MEFRYTGKITRAHSGTYPIGFETNSTSLAVQVLPGGGLRSMG